MKNGLLRKLTAIAIAAVVAFTAVACAPGDETDGTTTTTTTTTTAPADTEDTEEPEDTDEPSDSDDSSEPEDTDDTDEPSDSDDSSEPEDTEPPAPDYPSDRYDASEDPRTGNNATQPLVVGTGTMDGKFSPFFYTSAYDNDIVAMTSASLLSSNKDGEPVAGLEDPSLAYSYDVEVSDDESQSKYTFVLKNGITFSDGEPLTIADVLFSFYVYSDPVYDGISTLYSLDIPGMSEYRFQTSSEMLEVVEDILNAGISGDVDSGIEYGELEGPATPEQQEAFWSYLDEAGTQFAQEIVDYVVAGYGTSANYVPRVFDVGVEAPGEDATDEEKAAFNEAVAAKAEEIQNDESMQVIFGMALWGFGGTEDGVFTDASGNTYTIGEDEVTAEDYWANILDAYGYDLDPDAGINYEAAGSTYVEDYASSLFFENEAAVEGGVTEITGITTGTVVGEDGVERESLEIIVNGVDPTAIFKLGIRVSPMHYYNEGYTGELNDYGVDTGNRDYMEHLKSKNDHPVGPGPYVFEDYTDNIVTFTANDNYFMGSPKIQTIRYQEIAAGSEMDSLTTGTIHYANPSATTAIIADITEGAGDYAKLDYTLVDNDGYGYIGIQAELLPEFEVRQAIVHAINPELSISDYYGELASVNYRTMTKVQWAYPDNPEPIYPYDETGETSKALFEEAGYTYDEATNVMSYPDDHERAGQQVTIKFTLPSESADHPAGVIFLDAQQVLASIGVSVEIEVDTALLSKLSTAADSNIQVWAAAWGSGGVDPDMFQIWYSDPAVNTGTSPERSGIFYQYQNGPQDVKDMLTELNELIVAGRSTLDQEERKVIYAQALELSTSLAVEIPTYQRKNMIAFNSDVIDVDTLFTGDDVTPFRGPMDFVWQVELVG